MIAAIKVIGTTIIAGLILLIFEHWTGWFSERTRLPEIRLAVSRWIKEIPPTFLKFFPLIKNVIGAYTLLLSMYINFILLTPEARTNNSLRGWALAFLALVAFGSAKLMDLPMGNVTAFLLAINILAACIFIGPPSFTSFNWRMFFNISNPDLADVRTVSLIVTWLMIVILWIIADIISRHIRRLEARIDEEISLLVNAPGIALMLKEGEEELYNSIATQWSKLLEHLMKQDSDIADLIHHYVPLHIHGYCLCLGCKTLTDVSNIIDPIHAGKRTLPARKFQLERSIRDFFKNHFLTITAEKIDPKIFEEIWIQANQLEKKGNN